MDEQRGASATKDRAAETASGPALRPCGRCGAENPVDSTLCAVCHALLAAYDAPSGSQTAPAGTEPLAAAAAHPSAAVASPVAEIAGAPPAVQASSTGRAEPAAVDAPVDLPIEPDAAARAATEAGGATLTVGQEVPTAGAEAADSPVPPAEELAGLPSTALVEPVPAEVVVFAPSDQAADRPIAALPVPEPPVTAMPAALLPAAPAPTPVPARSPDRSPHQVAAPTWHSTVPASIGRPAPAAPTKPVVPSPRPPTVAMRPRKAGKLARTSPESLLIVGLVLSLASCVLIGVADAAGGVGTTGATGLVVGAIALFVVAVGLVQAVLRRGRTVL
jgi:hypothetical protein